MAPPLAGSMNMRASTFLRLDFAGTLLYTGSYLLVGFIFSGALEAITRGYDSAGRIVGWVIVALVVAYLLSRSTTSSGPISRSSTKASPSGRLPRARVSM